MTPTGSSVWTCLRDCASSTRPGCRSRRRRADPAGRSPQAAREPDPPALSLGPDMPRSDLRWATSGRHWGMPVIGPPRTKIFSTALTSPESFAIEAPLPGAGRRCASWQQEALHQDDEKLATSARQSGLTPAQATAVSTVQGLRQPIQPTGKLCLHTRRPRVANSPPVGKHFSHPQEDGYGRHVS